MVFILSILVFFLFGRSYGAEISTHIVRQDSYWRDYKIRPFDQRVSKAPPELIDYLRKDNEMSGWPNRPFAIDLPNDFKADVIAAIGEIPESLRNKILNKLVGIFIVEDLGGSAYSDYTISEKGLPISGFIVLDKTVLSRTANEWATWKESSPFKTTSSNYLEARIESDPNNNRKNALQYILLHEFGHILSIGSPLLPLWGESLTEQKIKPTMKFFNLSWQVKGSILKSKFESQWPERKLVAYYSSDPKKLDSTLIMTVYEKLFVTNFPSLYAATNPFDDFAESFASFVHCEILKKPWMIKLVSGTVYSSCWADSRCREKRAIIESVISN